jgi:hypothetical protein
MTHPGLYFPIAIKSANIKIFRIGKYLLRVFVFNKNKEKIIGTGKYIKYIVGSVFQYQLLRNILAKSLKDNDQKNELSNTVDLVSWLLYKIKGPNCDDDINIPKIKKIKLVKNRNHAFLFLSDKRKNNCANE